MKLSSEKATDQTEIVISSLVAFIILCVAAAFFEYAPVIDGARSAFPKNFGSACDCSCVLESRPWYGRINPWLWFWLISTPVVVFSAKPGTPALQRAGRIIFIISLSYLVINLATHSAMDIRNAPFQNGGISEIDGVRVTSDEDAFKFHCFDIADGAKYTFAFLFGWLPALVYAGWWENLWGVYHKRKTRLIDANFKRDWVSKIVAISSLGIPVLLAGWMALKYISGVE